MLRNVVLIGLLAAAIPAAHVTADGPSANLLANARWQYSDDAGSTWTGLPPRLTGSTNATFHARTTFTAATGDGNATLVLTTGDESGQEASFRLNGSDLPLPLAGMHYHEIQAPATGLRSGDNRLEVIIRYQGGLANSVPLALPTKLTVQSADGLKIVTGPVLGSAGEDFFTVTCRTNMPARVTLSAKADVTSSPSGLFHRLRVPAANKPERYVLTVRPAAAAEPVIREQVDRPLFPTAGLRFAVCGDSRSNPPAWKNVADAMAATRPHLAVHTGDLVRHGLSDWQWNEQFFDPAARLTRAVPFFAVLGNHDTDAPIFDEMIYNPKRKPDPHWQQEINGVLLIGIDGAKDFSASSPSARWLEETLAASKARFIFLFTHYPAWTSGAHGELGKDGRPKLRYQRDAQDVIIPLLVRHKATALFAGHDHFYERSELPGISHVITAAAGASQRRKGPEAGKQNPYSKVFASKLHYCLVEVAGDTAVMTARTPGGEVIDRCTWKARTPSGSVK